MSPLQYSFSGIAFKLVFFFCWTSGLNFADIMQRQGMYPSPKKPPFVPGMECAGTIEEIGENVTSLEVRGLVKYIFKKYISGIL